LSQPVEKLLLAHIYSFGENGCWQSNKTLAEMFMTSKRTIQIWLASLEKYISIQNPKGYYRTIWAKSHPDFLQRGAKDCADVRKKVYSDCAKSFVSLRKNLRPTNINTMKENNNRTTATPSPPPCKGAPALLAERFVIGPPRRLVWAKLRRLSSVASPVPNHIFFCLVSSQTVFHVKHFL